MSQPLAGVFGSLGAKTKGHVRRRKPGPEWEKPLGAARFQMALAGTACMVNAVASAHSFNLPNAATAAYDGWLFLKGWRNYQVTRQSADEAPLRDLLGADAPANDNLLTPNQSLSNSHLLISRGFYGVVAQGMAIPVFNTLSKGNVDVGSHVICAISCGLSMMFGRSDAAKSRSYGPPKLPPLFPKKDNGPKNG